MATLWSNSGDATDPTTVVALDANLASVPVATQGAILLYVYATLSASRWGTKLDLAAQYLAAHMGALQLRGASQAGTTPLTMQHLGDASEQYASPTMVDPMMVLDLTIFGQFYRRLVRQLGVIGVVL